MFQQSLLHCLILGGVFTLHNRRRCIVICVPLIRLALLLQLQLLIPLRSRLIKFLLVLHLLRYLRITSLLH